MHIETGEIIPEEAVREIDPQCKKHTPLSEDEFLLVLNDSPADRPAKIAWNRAKQYLSGPKLSRKAIFMLGFKMAKRLGN